MTGPAVSVFTPSYDKPQYAPEAVASVLAQEFGDFEYWIIENSDDGGKTRAALTPLLDDPRVIYEEAELTGADRRHCYPPAMLMNRYYPKANGRYILYLSDDDLLEPACLARCVGELEAHPDWDVVWFTLWRSVWSAAQGRFRPAGSIPAVNAVGVGTGQAQADCRVDGGQVFHRRSCLDRLDQPWFPEGPGTANHADGVFLQKLADLYPFHPVPEHLMTHRCTPLSAWDKP